MTTAITTKKERKSLNCSYMWLHEMEDDRGRISHNCSTLFLFLFLYTFSQRTAAVKMSFMNKLQQGISRAGEQAASFGSGLQKQVGSNQSMQGITSNFSLEKEWACVSLYTENWVFADCFTVSCHRCERAAVTLQSAFTLIGFPSELIATCWNWPCHLYTTSYRW